MQPGVPRINLDVGFRASPRVDKAEPARGAASRRVTARRLTGQRGPAYSLERGAACAASGGNKSGQQ